MNVRQKDAVDKAGDIQKNGLATPTFPAPTIPILIAIVFGDPIQSVGVTFLLLERG
jgi:hypothetical protein